MALESQAKSGVRWTALSGIATSVIELLRPLILVLFLSPADFGLMAMAMVVIGLSELWADLGLTAAIIHRQDVTKEQLSSLYWLSILTGLIGFVCLWVSSPLIAAMFREPRLVPILRVVAIAFVIAPIGKQFDILLQKDLMFKVVETREIATSLVSFIVAVGCAVSGLGVWSLVYGFLAGVIVKALLFVRVGLARFRPSLHFRGSDLRGFVSFGLFQLGERTTNYLGRRLDQILIATLLGAEALGFYYVAFNLVWRPIWRINPIITRVAFPVFSRIQHDTERLKKGYIRVVGSLTAVNAPLLLGLAAVAPLAVEVLLGHKWSPSAVLIQILSLAALLRSTMNPIGSLQLAKGRPDLGFKWHLLSLAVTAPVIVMGGLVGGAAGVAVSLVITHLILLVPLYFISIRPLIGNCAYVYTLAMVRPMLLAGTMAVAVKSLPHLLLGSPEILLLILQVAFGSFVYVALLRLFHRPALQEFRNVVFAY